MFFWHKKNSFQDRLTAKTGSGQRLVQWIGTKSREKQITVLKTLQLQKTKKKSFLEKDAKNGFNLKKMG